MKKVTLTTLILGLVLATGIAHANYECESSNNESTLTVNEHHITHLGNASIVITAGAEKTQYFGQIYSDGGMLLGKKVIELYPFLGDTLTIVSMPKSCGRGSCNFNAEPIITANLKIGETKTYYFCDETSP